MLRQRIFMLRQRSQTKYCLPSLVSGHCSIGTFMPTRAEISLERYNSKLTMRFRRLKKGREKLEDLLLRLISHCCSLAKKWGKAISNLNSASKFSTREEVERSTTTGDNTIWRRLFVGSRSRSATLISIIFAPYLHLEMSKRRRANLISFPGSANDGVDNDED